MSTFYTRVDPLGNDLLVRGFEDGKPIMKRVPYKPYMFVPCRTDTKYKTIDGKPVDKLHFDSMRDCRDYIRQYKDVAVCRCTASISFTSCTSTTPTRERSTTILL